MAISRRFLALEDPDPKNMTVIEHLEELRHRLLICVIVITVAALASLFFYDAIINLLTRPMHGLHNTAFGQNLVFKTITGPLFLRIKLAIIPAVVITLPVLLYQLWMFVAPAFEVETRRYVVPFVGFGLLLFILGATIGYLVFPRYYSFMIGIGGSKTVVIVDANDFLNQFGVIVLLFGAVFELPIVLTLLSRVNIVSSPFLRRKRKVAIIIALFAGMIITPGADPITPLIVAGLLIILYEVSIVLIRLGHR